MKYYYKTPEQVQKEIEEHIKRNKKSPYNKTFYILFLNIIIIMLTLFILNKTGILHQTFSYKSIKSVYYKIEGNYLLLYFDVYRPIILTSSNSKDDYVLQLQQVKLTLKENQSMNINPQIPKTIIDKESNILKIELNNTINREEIQSIQLMINKKIIEVQKLDPK
jgi:hypothetical protein